MSSVVCCRSSPSVVCRPSFHGQSNKISTNKYESSSVSAVFFLYNLCRLFIDDPYYATQRIKFWIYFTNWGLILLNTRLLMGALFLAEASEPQEFAVPSSKQDSACVYLLRTSVMRYQTDNDVCLFKKSIIFLIFRCFRQHMRSSSTQAILWPSGLVSYSGWSSMIQSVSERGHGKITTSTPSTQSW